MKCRNCGSPTTFRCDKCKSPTCQRCAKSVYRDDDSGNKMSICRECYKERQTKIIVGVVSAIILVIIIAVTA